MLDSTEKVLAAYHRHESVGTGRIVDGMERVVEGIHIERVRVGGGEVCRIPIPAGMECLEIEIEGRLSRGVRAAIEARLYDQDNVALGICSPGHEFGRVTRLESGPFRLQAKFRLPPLLRGIFLLRVEMTDPGHAGLVDTGCRIELDVEGPQLQGPALHASASCGHQLLPFVE